MILYDDVPEDYTPVSDPVSVAETAEFYSVSGSGYSGMISTQFVDYFAGIAQKYWGKDYLLYRQDQYNYVMLYNGDLALAGSRVSGNAQAVRYYTGQSGYSASLSFLGEQAVDLNLSGLSVYSNLGDYPVLGGVDRAQSVLPYLLVLFVLVAFVASFFRGGR